MSRGLPTFTVAPIVGGFEVRVSGGSVGVIPGKPKSIDLEAIRKSAKDGPDFCILCGEFHKTHPPDHECACRQKCLDPNVAALVDALLAEVERLNEALRIAVPWPVERAYVKVAPDALRKYLALCPYCRQDHPREVVELRNGFEITICPNAPKETFVMVPP
jgi:hypothetical protein